MSDKRLISVAMILGLMLLVGVGVCMDALQNRCRRQFEKNVTVGLPKATVRARVDDPSEILQKGDVLPAWGGTAAEKVPHETWVYYVFPKSQHRFVVGFEQGKVVRSEHQQN